MGEMPLEMATRHVREMEALVAKQKKIVAIDAAEQPADLARASLVVMRRTLELAREHKSGLSDWRAAWQSNRTR
jgi:hypothetical protein